MLHYCGGNFKFGGPWVFVKWPLMYKRVNLDSSDHTTFFWCRRVQSLCSLANLSLFLWLTSLISGFLTAAQSKCCFLLSLLHIPLSSTNFSIFFPSSSSKIMSLHYLSSFNKALDCFHSCDLLGAFLCLMHANYLDFSMTKECKIYIYF